MIEYFFLFNVLIVVSHMFFFFMPTTGCKSGCGGGLESYSHCSPHNETVDVNKKSAEGTSQEKGKDNFRLVLERWSLLCHRDTVFIVS